MKKHTSFDKVIIWGHKFSHYHTHTHIHSSYFKAFKAMGFDTYWLENSDADKLSDLDYGNCLFFTEAQVDQNIPLIRGATYILHHCNVERYLNNGCNILNLCNYVKYCEDGNSFNYPGGKVEKISDLFFYDSKNKGLYQPWATDLLPEEIDTEDICIYDPMKEIVNYVGSIWGENINQMNPFVDACRERGIKFKNYAGGVSDAENKRLIRESYIAPDIRGEWHKECGYIPCRIFKNISYGQNTGINSLHVYNLFGDMIAYNDNTHDLFETCVEKAKITTKEQMRRTMIFVKEKHTYINRINNIFYILERIGDERS